MASRVPARDTRRWRLRRRCDRRNCGKGALVEGLLELLGGSASVPSDAGKTGVFVQAFDNLSLSHNQIVLLAKVIRIPVVLLCDLAELPKGASKEEAKHYADACENLGNTYLFRELVPVGLTIRLHDKPLAPSWSDISRTLPIHTRSTAQRLAAKMPVLPFQS